MDTLLTISTVSSSYMIFWFFFIATLFFCCNISKLFGLITFEKSKGLYSSKVCKEVIFIASEGRWFSEKSGDVAKSEGGVVNSQSSLGSQNISVVENKVEPSRGEKGLVTVMDVEILKGIIQKVVMEAVREVIKDLVVKKVKKKNDRVVGEGVDSPKKKVNKKVLTTMEVGDGIVELDRQELALSGKKKKSSKKKESVLKDELLKG